jgi:8-oxo-dGTP pyrophosphatase MutT (NUDIX family)
MRGMNQHPLVRPRDAATLIVLRDGGKEREILMGRRHMRHKFMPGKYVFPGGRVDFADSRIKAAGTLSQSTSDRLMARMRGQASEGRARAMALAAIRETFEETGLAIGVPTDGPPATSKSAAWQTFYDSGTLPDLRNLHLVARAITPPGRVRRFDTRFFAVDQNELAHAEFLGSPSEELEEVDWLTFTQARELDLPTVTRMVLDIIQQRLKSNDSLAVPHAVPFYFWRRDRWIRDEL